MKTVTLALALCLVTSIAMADTPTDAPLLPENPQGAVSQSAKADSQARKPRGKKDNCMARQARKATEKPASMVNNVRWQTGQRTDDPIPSM